MRIKGNIYKHQFVFMLPVETSASIRKYYCVLLNGLKNCSLFINYSIIALYNSDEN